jgi:hypothetical protein
LDSSKFSKYSEVSEAQLSIVSLATVIGTLKSLILLEPKYDKDINDCQGISLYDNMGIVDYNIYNVMEDGEIVCSISILLVR